VRSFRTLFQRAIALPLYRHYLKLSVTGLQNLNSVRPPVIFAANHTSHLDVPTIFAALPRQWRHRLAPAMMKDHFRAYFEPHRHTALEIVEAAGAYFFACALYNAYPLPQKMSGTRRALAYTGELVSRAYCPIVFPEGLRTVDGRLGTFRPGIGMMAERLRIPIIPIRLSGLYEIYSVHDSWPRRGPIRVAIGPPQSFDEQTSYEEVSRRLREAIEKL
jgi:long-chain acyl-CoA synthetase